MASIDADVTERLFASFPPYSDELFEAAVAGLGRPLSEQAREKAAGRIKARHEVLVNPSQVLRELSRMPPIGLNRLPDSLVFDDADAIVAEYLLLYAQQRA